MRDSEVLKLLIHVCCRALVVILTLVPGGYIYGCTVCKIGVYELCNLFL